MMVRMYRETVLMFYRTNLYKLPDTTYKTIHEKPKF